MVSIAILGGAVATIGQLTRVGARSAAEARDLAKAQLLCESTLAEITIGMIPLETAGPTPVETYDADDQWVYTLEVMPVEQQGLLAIRVTVQQNLPLEYQPISYSLVRWMIDPEVEMQLEQSASEMMTDSSVSGSGVAY